MGQFAGKFADQRSEIDVWIKSIARSTASIDLRLNGGALAEAGTTLEAGTQKIYDNLIRSGWQIRRPVVINATALRSFPTTWAKRLAVGRDPHAITIKWHLR